MLQHKLEAPVWWGLRGLQVPLGPALSSSLFLAAVNTAAGGGGRPVAVCSAVCDVYAVMSKLGLGADWAVLPEAAVMCTWQRAPLWACPGRNGDSECTSSGCSREHWHCEDPRSAQLDRCDSCGSVPGS